MFSDKALSRAVQAEGRSGEEWLERKCLGMKYRQGVTKEARK